MYREVFLSLHAQDDGTFFLFPYMLLLYPHNFFESAALRGPQVAIMCRFNNPEVQKRTTSSDFSAGIWCSFFVLYSLIDKLSQCCQQWTLLVIFFTTSLVPTFMVTKSRLHMGNCGNTWQTLTDRCDWQNLSHYLVIERTRNFKSNLRVFSTSSELKRKCYWAESWACSMNLQFKASFK